MGYPTLTLFLRYRPCSLEGTNKAELLLNQLILGWEGSALKVVTSYLPDRVVFCALNKFGTILVKSLSGVKKIQNYLTEYEEIGKAFVQNSQSLTEHYEKECGKKFI
jgi:hypothetical protein